MHVLFHTVLRLGPPVLGLGLDVWDTDTDTATQTRFYGMYSLWFAGFDGDGALTHIYNGDALKFDNPWVKVRISARARSSYQ